MPSQEQAPAEIQKGLEEIVGDVRPHGHDGKTSCPLKLRLLEYWNAEVSEKADLFFHHPFIRGAFVLHGRPALAGSYG